MSRTIDRLAAEAGTDPDAYVATHNPHIPDAVSAPWPDTDRPPEPASAKNSQHQRRRYAAMRSRSQVR